MSNSGLVVHTNVSPNCSKPRNAKIDTITIHCVVGQCTAETIGNIFKPTTRQASSNYGVDKDGRIGMYVEECNRSWCTSSSSNDNRAITIEVASDTTHPYAVNDKAFNTLLDLVTDICKRNDIKKLLWNTDKSLIGQIDKLNMTVHRWFANKSCPGDYLYNLHGKIADEVNKRLLGNETPSQPNTSGFKIGDIVNFKGGKHYSSSNGATASTVKSGKAKITQIYNGKHPYHIIGSQAGAGSTNSNVYGWVDTIDITAISTTVTPSKSIEEIAKEVINGKWGNGQERKDKLTAAGYDYNTVQAKVTALLK